MGVFLVLVSLLVAAFGLVNVVYPLKLIGITTRGKGAMVLGAGFVLLVVGIIVTVNTLPDAPPASPASTAEQPKQADKQSAAEKQEPQVDAKAELDQLLESMRLNFAGTSWFGDAKNVELEIRDAGWYITVETDLYHKDSNKENAKSVCRGFAMGTVDQVTAPKVDVSVKAADGLLFASCTAKIKDGKLASPIEFF